jgi:aminoglycoside 6'-N-acetyltransferase
MLQGDRLQLRPLARGDLERLDLINREPAVARWWRPGEFERWPLDDDVERFAIVVDGEVAGLIQCEDPAAANATAIRSYERVGFRPVGVMRRYQIDPASGDWADSLLMDLLAEELEVG